MSRLTWSSRFFIGSFANGTKSSCSLIDVLQPIRLEIVGQSACGKEGLIAHSECEG
jgi:hypothetical protein